MIGIFYWRNLKEVEEIRSEYKAKGYKEISPYEYCVNILLRKREIIIDRPESIFSKEKLVKLILILLTHNFSDIVIITSEPHIFKTIEILLKDDEIKKKVKILNKEYINCDIKEAINKILKKTTETYFNLILLEQKLEEIIP